MNQAPSQFLRPMAIIKILEGNKKLEKYRSIIVCYLEKSFMTASLYNLELIYKPRFLGTSSDFQIAAWL